MSDSLRPHGLQHARPPCPSPTPGIYSNSCPLSQCPITSRQIEGEKVEVVTEFLFLGSKITADGDWSHEIRRHLLLGRKAMTNLDSVLKSRDITVPSKVCIVKAMVLPVVIYGCEIWTVKKSAEELMPSNYSAGEDSWNSYGSKETQPVNLKGNQPWILVGRTDAEAEAPILWSPDAKSWLIRKDPDAGKDWRQEESGETEDKMAGWHHWCNGHELGQTSGDGEGQRGLVCSSPRGHKELDRTGKLNSNNTETQNLTGFKLLVSHIEDKRMY